MDDLAELIQNNPDFNFQIGGHADSRRTYKYNIWLSERRMKRTIDYLLDKGVGNDNFTYNANRKHQLVNECKDGNKLSQ